MKLYVIFTVDIHPIGGNQLFTNEIARYLNRINEWEVKIIHFGSMLGNCKISELDKYLSGGCPFFALYKPADCHQDMLEKIYKNTLRNIDVCVGNYEEIYVGAQNNNIAIWAEYFAGKLGAKMICFDVSEVFRGPGYCYEEYIDFYKFKFYRNELFSLDIERLFDGYMVISNPQDYKVVATEGNPIKDIDQSIVDDICRLDYNIAYIGRSEKKYVPSVIRGIESFSRKHNDKMIQVIFVGNVEKRLQFIADKLMRLPNVKVLLLGDMVPIPRSLFNIVDTVIAGSGAATYSANEKAPVIVVDADNCRANGILGYTCGRDETLYHKKDNEQSTIENALEDVLIEKKYLSCKKTEIKLDSSDEIIRVMLEKFNFTSPEKKYYQVEERAVDRKINRDKFINKTVNIEKLRLLTRALKNKRTILFGAGHDGVECLNWLKNINIHPCFITDNDSKKWYTEISGLEIMPLEELENKLEYFYIISTRNYEDEIKKQLIDKEHIPEESIIFYSELKEYDTMMLLW